MATRKKPAKAKGRGKTGAKKVALNRAESGQPTRVPKPTTRTKFEVALGLIAVGHSKRGACAGSGIARSTFDDLAKDPVRAEAVKEAEDRGVFALEQCVLMAAPGDWRPAIRALESKAPAEWGKNVKVSGEVNVNTVGQDPRVAAMRADPAKAAKLDALLDALGGD